MIDHITIRVNDLEKSKIFYETVLMILGYKQNIGGPKEGYYGFGFGADPIFEISQASTDFPAHENIHIAFKANTKEQIHEFYTVAIANGAIDNGKPGPRPQYTPTYYAAFFIDPNGNNIEACLY